MSDSTRRTRASDSRALQERTSEREPIAYYTNSLFTIPPALKDAYPHKVFGWIRFAFQNSGEDRDNYFTAVEQHGWDPVPPTLCPELMNRQALSPFERANRVDELIRRRGHVLMWCDREPYEQRMAAYDSRSQLHGQMSTLCREGNLTPLVDERRVQIE